MSMVPIANALVLFSPPIFIPLALGVAPPSLSSAPVSPAEAEGFSGDERKNNGDWVEAEAEADCSLAFRGVACDPRCEACEASD